jgi:hypothetical protein
MPRARHAAQHSGHRDQQRQARQDRAPASLRQRTRTLRYGSVALAAAFALLVGTAVMRAAANHGSTAALSALSCSSTPRLAANTSVTTATPLGVNVGGGSGLATATAQFGHMPVLRAFYGAVVPNPREWSTGVLGRNNSSVVLSFRPPPADILSGADDAALAHFFDAAPRGHVIYYSYYHEPEAHIKAGQFTFAQYKAAWTHIVAIADAAHNPYLHSTLILQHQDALPRDQYNFRDYLPAGGVISTLGWDAYPVGTDDGHPQPTPPAQFMGPVVAASKSVGLPFGFAEFALGTPTDRPQWLTEVANYMQSNGALFGTLFDASGFPWSVLHDSASIQAWRTAVARSASNVPVAGPMSTPTPAPTSPKSSPAPKPAKSTPAPVPSSSAPAARGPVITRFSITPRTLWVTSADFVGLRFMRVRIRFKLSQAADVSICVLNSHGAVVREMDRPGLPAGWATRWYYGYDQHHRLLPAGSYQVMVTASNAAGVGTAQLGLTVTGGRVKCNCALDGLARR